MRYQRYQIIFEVVLMERGPQLGKRRYGSLYQLLWAGCFRLSWLGLGRAVGETMIVLMAGGNTSVEDWNMFNGFRTLSANIAVELPEAVRNSTHYRTLFLAALTLFVLTFVVNTIAELVRLRFRKRAYQLWKTTKLQNPLVLIAPGCQWWLRVNQWYGLPAEV